MPDWQTVKSIVRGLQTIALGLAQKEQISLLCGLTVASECLE